MTKIKSNSCLSNNIINLIKKFIYNIIYIKNLNDKNDKLIYSKLFGHFMSDTKKCIYKI